MQWPANVTAFCAGRPDEVVTQSCGPYRVVTDVGVDGGSNYYYSAATEQLVAVASYNANFQTAMCLGGPSDFVQPNCTAANVNVDCPDAGP